MTFRPSYIVFDVETEELGEASTEFYRPGFYVSSCAFAWRGEDGQFKTHYIEGPGTEKRVLAYLTKIAEQQIPLISHNEQYEYGVTLCRFPRVCPELNWHADTMRLVQVYDNGGGEFQFLPLTYDEQLDFYLSEQGEGEAPDPSKEAPKGKFVGGLGLKNAAMRILGIPDHKKAAHEWLRENVEGCRRGNEGSYLHMLPPDVMREYNIADVITTARLYEHCTDEFKRLGYDWTVDHMLYRSTLRHVVASKIRGVRVLRESLAKTIELVTEEIATIERTFREQCADGIRSVERSRLLRRIGKLKRLRSRKAYLTRFRAPGSRLFDDEIRFNIGSNLQLEALFMGFHRMECKFRTEKGAPAFRSAVLHQWGDKGEMLKTRRKRLLVLKQAESLYALSEYDGRWHVSLKVAACATGRLAAGG